MAQSHMAANQARSGTAWGGGGTPNKTAERKRPPRGFQRALPDTSIEAFRAYSAQMPLRFASQRVELEGSVGVLYKKKKKGEGGGSSCINQGDRRAAKNGSKVDVRKSHHGGPKGAGLAVCVICRVVVLFCFSSSLMEAVGWSRWSICARLSAIIILMPYGNRRRLFSYSSSSSSLHFEIPEIRRKGAFTSAVTSFLVSLLDEWDGVRVKQMLLLI